MTERRDAARCGTRRQYELGCRCFPCRLEAYEYQMDLRNGKARRVPKKAVAEHVEKLLASGMRRTEIQEMAGLSNSAIYNLFHGAAKSLNSRNAAALLAIEPDDDLRSHLRDLIRSGWTAASLAAETGLYIDTVKYAIKGSKRPYAKTRKALLAVEPLEQIGKLDATPLVSAIEVRAIPKGGIVGFLDSDALRRSFYRAKRTGVITEAAADELAIAAGLLLEELYGDWWEVAA